MTILDSARDGFHGITQGIVFDILDQWWLSATDRFEMLRLRYTLHGASARLDFCDTLGDPPVSTEIVVGGIAYPPATKKGAQSGSAPTSCQAKVCEVPPVLPATSV